jgi:hypothetical protein
LLLCDLFIIDEITVTRTRGGESEKCKQNCGRKPEAKILLGDAGVGGREILKQN